MHDNTTPHGFCRVTDCVTRRMEQMRRERPPGRRLATTLTYAQSLDGSIAAHAGEALQLSNPYSLAMTHRLRACHDAVMVGINTVLADDPRLTVRLAPGANPQPVVLDGDLRFPVQARLLREPGRLPPILFTSLRACPRAEERLRSAGARVVRVPTLRSGLLDLAAVLARLESMGIGSLMVEGGARVITSFLQGRFADLAVLTISPQFVGGLRGVKRTRQWANRPPRLAEVVYESYGADLVVFGSLREAPPVPADPAAERSRPGASVATGMQTTKV